MIHIEQIDVNGRKMLGVRMQFGKAPILLIRASKGFLACAYFSTATADRVEDALAVVSGVSTFEDMLNAEVQAVSKKAEELGVKAGMEGKDALIVLDGK